MARTPRSIHPPHAHHTTNTRIAASPATAAAPPPLQVLWAKGYTELLDRLKEHTDATGQPIHVDVYGSGPDLKVRAWAHERGHGWVGGQGACAVRSPATGTAL